MRQVVFLLSAAAAAVLFSATLENGALQVCFDERTAAFAVTDRRTGRIWEQLPEAGAALAVQSVSAVSNAVAFTCRVAGQAGDLRGRIALEGAEVAVTLDADPALRLSAGVLAYPAPFRAEKGQRVLLPHGCGFAFPVERTDLGTKGFDAFPFWTRGMKMSTWGQYAEAVAPDGEVVAAGGVQAIVETPADARMTFGVRGNGLRQAGVVWQPENGAFGYARTVRFVFFVKGSPMEMAARYRAEMRRKGYLRTFAEKRARHPRLGAAYDLLAGAPVVWYWEQDGDKPAVARRLKELGFANFLFCGITRRDLGTWITPEEVREIAKIPGVLQSEYDIYTDLMEPAMLDRIDCVRPHWPVEAWDRDDIVRNPDGTPQRGWKVAFKTDPSKPVLGCARLCEARAPRYMRARIAKRLAEAPYGARFLDVTGTGVGTCANPKHPLTRRESAVARRRMFGMLADEFGLLCGTEDGLECYVPECDYLEGNFSAANYRVDGGRYMWKIYDETPAVIERALDPATRVPFWEMVFHDCIVSTWYWTDYNNKFPKAWWRHDLLNAVTGTPPMYLFTKRVFDGIQKDLAESVKVAVPAARETFGVAMTDYRWLTPDRLVQQSAFANGLRVTVNFGERPYRMKDGSELPSHGVRFAR
ncbi:MAG: glycoside hydrolase [Kiritimatiellae bacterium]|nr:glycoside hydrolase [Kiritimatiellia bacterium]